MSPPAIEEGLLIALNRARERAGRPPLRPLAALADVARAHSSRMAAASRLFHESDSEEPLTDRLVAAGIYFAKVGENVARSDSFLPAAIHQALLESPPHRENILDADFDTVGVGVFEASRKAYYVTEIFLQSIRVLDRKEAAAEMKRQVNELRRGAGVPDLVFWEEADRFAEDTLLLRSRGAQAPKPPARFGRVDILYFEFSHLSLKDLAVSDITKPTSTHAGLGLHFKRTKANPGGAYLLALLLMSDNLLNRPEAELSRSVLESINAKRCSIGIPSLNLSASLTAEAGLAASVAVGGAGQMIPTSLPEPGFSIVAYFTFDPADLPRQVEKQVLAPGLRRAGIQAVFRRTAEYPLGVIQVFIVVADRLEQ